MRFQLDLAKSHWIWWDFHWIWLNHIKSDEIFAEFGVFSSFFQNSNSDQPACQLLEVWFARSDQFLSGRRVNGSTRASQVGCMLSPNPIRPNLWTTLTSLLANKLLKTTRSQCFRSCGLESLDFGGYESCCCCCFCFFLTYCWLHG